VTNQLHVSETSKNSTAEVRFSPPPIGITTSAELLIDQLNDTAEVSIPN